tara:strand:- start:609 stop:1364 length:756 start_codon:yes stop_codon:yes gene_type:complete
MNRNEVATELLLRENIRRIINTVKQGKIDERRERILTENALRKVIRKLLNEGPAVPDEVPNRSTGINVLEELLKKIIPVLEADFKTLTSDEEQRGSFRAHVLNAIKNILTVADTNDDVSVMSEPKGDIEEDIDIKVSDDAKDDRFIDIEPEKETDPKDDFSKGLEGSNLDQTGRNVAFNSFKKIEQNILDSYELLDNQKDAKIFYDYLLTNVKLYFDKFEDELSGSVPDITTPEYEQAQEDAEEPAEDTEL